MYEWRFCNAEKAFPLCYLMVKQKGLTMFLYESSKLRHHYNRFLNDLKLFYFSLCNFVFRGCGTLDAIIKYRGYIWSNSNKFQCY